MLGIPWSPSSRPVLLGWTAFFGAFLVYAAFRSGEFLFIDHVNLIVHEAGHLLFEWLGTGLALWGGTILQLFVPAALAAHFAWRGELPGAIVCLFFFFENFLYISTYMADARVQALPLVTVGDPEMGVHDWFAIFSSLHLLPYDQSIAHVVRVVGWMGMGGSVGLLWHLGAGTSSNSGL